MSGNGDTGIGPAPATGETLNCKTISFQTQLASPDPMVTASLKKDDILVISLAGPQGPLKALTQSGQVAGGILTSKMNDLIDCINNGFEYKAIVLNINGGQCKVSVTAV